MIDEQHHFARLAKALFSGESARRRLRLLPDDELVLSSPASAGFKPAFNPYPGSIADWVQPSFIRYGRYQINVHVCLIDRKWYGYYTVNPETDAYFMKESRFSQWPELESVYVLRKLAWVMQACAASQLWEEMDRVTGRFTGRAVLVRSVPQEQIRTIYGDESSRLARVFVNSDCSFRIAWYAEEIVHLLQGAFDRGDIYRVPGEASRGTDPLKDRMGLRALPEPEGIRVENESVIAKDASPRDWMDC